MHDCPNCGQACYCSGDIDDCPVYLEPFLDCKCDCEGFDPDEDDYLSDVDAFLDDPDNWTVVALNQLVLESYVSALAAEADHPAQCPPDR